MRVPHLVRHVILPSGGLLKEAHASARRGMQTSLGAKVVLRQSQEKAPMAGVGEVAVAVAVALMMIVTVIRIK